jgi:hypothetical protein
MFVHMVMLEHPIDSPESQELATMVDPFVQLAFVNDAINDLTRANLDHLDRDWFARCARSIDELTARLDTISIEAAEAQRRGHGRIQTMHMFEPIPTWATAPRTGEVGIAQTRLMARVAANPRVHDALLDCAESLLTDAVVLPYDEFERKLRDFQRSADQTGADKQARQNHAARDAMMRQKADGSWILWAIFGSLQGAHINEWPTCHEPNTNDAPTQQQLSSARQQPLPVTDEHQSPH